MLSSKVLGTAEGASRFNALIAESQANAERLLSQDEKAKMKLTIPPEVEERKRQVIARMRQLQKQGKATIKTNP